MFKLEQEVLTSTGSGRITKVWNSKPVCYTVLFPNGKEEIIPEEKILGVIKPLSQLLKPASGASHEANT